jgi:hypothetical protein
MFDRQLLTRMAWGSGVAIAILASSMGNGARSQNAPCQPPPSGDYLLLVDSATSADQKQVSDLLPPTLETNICRYQQSTVTRIGSFPNQPIANAWADYISKTLGLESLVVEAGNMTAGQTQQGFTPTNRSRQNTNSAADASPTNKNNTTYAVLVDFFNRPEIAQQLQEILGKDIGLVAYAQKHYLLVATTDRLEAANETMQQLSDRGFWATIVDNRRITVLTESVRVSPGDGSE